MRRTLNSTQGIRIGQGTRPRWPWLALVLLLPLLAACGDSGSGGDPIAWREVDPHTPGVATPTPQPAAGGATEFPVRLGPDDLARVQPNELGHVPILMYHGFTTDDENTNEWIVTLDTFRDDLEWLYEHDFYVIPLADMINNEIAAPPGKHPVVLTFDDSSSGQFRLLRDVKGEFVPDPTTAVGVMEAFFAEHPDFGRGGFFAVLPYNCFHKDGEVSTCEERLEWLAGHGYEIGNHTWTHQELGDVSDERLMEEIARAKIWIDERVVGDANLGNVVVLPYGTWPSHDWQVQLIHDGFVYEGQQIIIAGIVTVVGGLSESPSSGEWTRWDIARFNTDREVWGGWQDKIESGVVTLFTSDGNPATVTIPNQLPEDIATEFDPEWAQAYGMELIRYDLPDQEPAIAGFHAPPLPQPVTRRRWSSPERRRPA